MRPPRLLQCRGPGATPARDRRLRRAWGWLGREGAAVPGQGELGEAARAGLHSPREAALLGEAVLYFVPEVTASGFASALGAADGQRRARLWAPGRRGSPQPSAVATFFVLPALFSLVPACRESRGPATRSHWLRAPGGGVDGRGGPPSPDAGTLAWPSLSPGRHARGCLDAYREGSTRGPCEPRGSKTRRQPGLLTPQRAPFPWVQNWVNSVLASSGASRLLGSDPARRLSPPHRLPRWRGPGGPPEPAVGELAHVVPEARVALPSGARL